MENIKQWIEENRDEKYQTFTAQLTDSGRPIQGVRIPKLREKAKQLVHQYDLDGLELLSDDSFEEVLLQGLVIGYSKELIEIKEDFIYQYLLKADNWALIDSFVSTLKLKKDEKDIFYQIVKGWENSELEYVVRFVLVYYLDYCLDEDHIDEILSYCSTLVNRSYTVKMANGWLLATAYIHYPERVRELLGVLDEQTYRYTKGKIRDSFRISAEEKAKFVR